MSGVSGASKEAIRRLNLSAAMTHVHGAEELSRSELVERLGVSRTTVAELLTHLATLGLVTERDQVASRGVGRPNLLVSVSPLVGAFALNPEIEALNVGFVNLSGELTHFRGAQWSGMRTAEETARLAAQVISEITAELPAGTTVLGCGVAVPGQVSRQNHRIMGAPSLQWEETDLVDLLERELLMPVRVDNNARLTMQAEHRMGVGKNCKDLVYIFAAAGGIGGGVMSGDGTIYGKSGFAGELGRMLVPVHCPESDEWKSVALEDAVRLEDLVEVLGVGRNTPFSALDLIVQTSNDPEFLRLAKLQLGIVAVAVCSIANVLDPQLIVLGGFLGSLYKRFPSILDEAANRWVLPQIRDGLTLSPPSDPLIMVMIGASHLLVRELLEDPVGVLEGPLYNGNQHSHRTDLPRIHESHRDSDQPPV